MDDDRSRSLQSEATRLADAEPHIALGALDGRYRGVVAPLVDHLSEPALNRARVHVEVDALGGGDHRAGWDDLSRLPLLRAVLDEALRLYPPAWVVTRKAAADDVTASVHDEGAAVEMSRWFPPRED